MAIWSILSPFGIICGIWYIFCMVIWYIFPVLVCCAKKSGNPGLQIRGSFCTDEKNVSMRPSVRGKFLQNRRFESDQRKNFLQCTFLNIFKHLFFSSTHNDNAY
jgi:hypothetical protein